MSDVLGIFFSRLVKSKKKKKLQPTRFLPCHANTGGSRWHDGSGPVRWIPATGLFGFRPVSVRSPNEQIIVVL